MNLWNCLVDAFMWGSDKTTDICVLLLVNTGGFWSFYWQRCVFWLELVAICTAVKFFTHSIKSLTLYCNIYLCFILRIIFLSFQSTKFNIAQRPSDFIIYIWYFHVFSFSTIGVRIDWASISIQFLSYYFSFVDNRHIYHLNSEHTFSFIGLKRIYGYLPV